MDNQWRIRLAVVEQIAALAKQCALFFFFGLSSRRATIYVETIFVVFFQDYSIIRSVRETTCDLRATTGPKCSICRATRKGMSRMD